MKLGYKLPIHIRVMHGKWKTLQYVYENVVAVVLANNRVYDGKFTGLSAYGVEGIFVNRISSDIYEEFQVQTHSLCI